MWTVTDVNRKDIIENFIAEVKLTEAGVNTCYQMIKGRQEPRGKK